MDKVGKSERDEEKEGGLRGREKEYCEREKKRARKDGSVRREKDDF